MTQRKPDDEEEGVLSQAMILNELSETALRVAINMLRRAEAMMAAQPEPTRPAPPGWRSRRRIH